MTTVLFQVDRGMRDVLRCDELFDCKYAIHRAFHYAKKVSISQTFYEQILHAYSVLRCFLVQSNLPNNDHSRYPNFLAVNEKWLLFRGSILLVAAVGRWLLCGGWSLARVKFFT